MQMQVTKIEDLKQINNIVKLPPFDNGTSFVAEIRRPNMLMLMANGTIPNPLLTTVMDVFQKGKGDEVTKKALNNAKDFKMFMELMSIIAQNTLVNPTYKQLEEANIMLNENQLMALFMYSQGGLKGLEHFCRNKEYIESVKHSEEV